MLKKLILGVLALPIITVLGLYTTGNGFFVNALQRTYLKGHATANINDAEAFSVRIIKTSTPQPLPKARNYNQKSLSNEFEAQLKKTQTAAYVVVQNGEVVSEHYFNGYHERSKTNSFSMAKTVLTMLVGIAIEEGYIKSLRQPVTDFIPEFLDDPRGKNATLANLSLMNSGYDWVEDYYSWFSPTVELYHGSDIEDFLVNRNFKFAPGEKWYYSSASTQLLSIVLQRALSAAGLELSLAQYLSEKIWQPLGMNDDALWHLDESGMELAYCCLNSNARNFAKLGLLMLNNGAWNGQQLVPAAFVQKMIQPDGQDFYGYSVWLNYQNNPPYYHFSGHLGQSINVIPEHRTVVVRLGEKRDNNKDFRLTELPEYVAEAMRLIH